MTAPDDGRSPLALGMYWSTRISSVGITMVLPAVLGYFGDRALGSSPWFLGLGAILGFALGMYELVKLAQAQAAKDGRKPPRGHASPQPPDSAASV